MQGATKSTHWGRVWLAGAFTWLCSTTVFVGESPFGWIYTADAIPKSCFEFEHRSFLQRGQSQGSYSGLLNREEVRYDVTDKFQLAGYLNWSYVNASRSGLDGTTRGPLIDPGPNDDPTRRRRKIHFETVSFETIYQLMNPVTDPTGLALYIESELGPRERSLEWRIILQKNWLDDRLIFAANILGAHERDKIAMGDAKRTSMLDLAAGVSYRLIDNLSLGMEARNHHGFQGYRYNRRDHSVWFLDPNLHYATKHRWVTAAWHHQLPVVKTYNEDQADVVAGNHIFGDEHARDEFIVKVGFPF